MSAERDFLMTAAPVVKPTHTSGSGSLRSGSIRLADTRPLNYPACLPGAFRAAAELNRAAGDGGAETFALTRLVSISGSHGVPLRFTAFTLGQVLGEPGHIGLEFAFASTPWLTPSNQALLASAAGHQIRSGPLQNAGPEICLAVLLFHPNSAIAQGALDTLLANHRSAPRVAPALTEQNTVVSILNFRSGGMPVQLVVPSRLAAIELTNSTADVSDRLRHLSTLLADRRFGPYGIASVWQHLKVEERALALNVLATAPASEIIGAVFARALFDSNGFVVSTAISGLFRAPRHLDQFAASGALAVASGPPGPSRSMAISLLTVRLPVGDLRLPILVSLACLADLQPAEALTISTALGIPPARIAELADEMDLPPPNLSVKDRVEAEEVFGDVPIFADIPLPPVARRAAA